MAKRQCKSDRLAQLEWEQDLRNAAIDAQIAIFAREEALGRVAAQVVGAGLFLLLVWLELVFLWTIH